MGRPAGYWTLRYDPHYHEQAPIGGYKMYNIDRDLLFSYKISRFICVCAFFVVPLRKNMYYGKDFGNR